MTNTPALTDVHAVYAREGDTWLPTELSRGPWDPRAQHGGAPCALLAHVAESAAPEGDWRLSRMSVELVKPVPVAPLRTQHSVQAARSTARVTIDLLAGDVLVASAHALLLRGERIALPADLPHSGSPAQLERLPAECSERVRIPGLPEGTSFYRTAMETRVAQGDPSQPGAAGAWFRLAAPLVQGVPTSPAMRAAAAADFGNGLSWVLPFDRYLFTNADLSLHLYREPVGEWVGLLSETQVDGGGAGMVTSRLYDEHGPIGIAVQTLVLRERAAA
ncbi:MULTISPECIES: thioesterase family protein [unclassified Variovorax]|uniref:thioesterase family protein n=1 Tax=unclassified Variovorax TaxID=663243 RepID=UPI001BD408E3|nr:MULTISPECIES: thioesterase family protein [unclassified Variovorax]